MPAFNAAPRIASAATDRAYQGFRDSPQSAHHANGIAQRHRVGARLIKLSPIDRDQEEIVTSALTLPPSIALDDLTADWPAVPPGADPLPGQLDRWLLAKGAELIAIRRHLHAHPELSGQEFNTAELVMPS